MGNKRITTFLHLRSIVCYYLLFLSLLAVFFVKYWMKNYTLEKRFTVFISFQWFLNEKEYYEKCLPDTIVFASWSPVRFTEF